MVIKLAEQSSAHDIKYCPLAATSQPPEMTRQRKEGVDLVGVLHDKVHICILKGEHGSEMTDSERKVLTLLGSLMRYIHVN